MLHFYTNSKREWLLLFKAVSFSFHSRQKRTTSYYHLREVPENASSPTRKCWCSKLPIWCVMRGEAEQLPVCSLGMFPVKKKPQWGRIPFQFPAPQTIWPHLQLLPAGFCLSVALRCMWGATDEGRITFDLWRETAWGQPLHILPNMQ